MVDTARTKAALQTLLADNTSGDISPQDLRDLMESISAPVDGGGFHQHYSPDRPPLSPDGADDEFSDGSVSGWTTWNPGTSITNTEDDYGGLKVSNNAASLKAGGVCKSIAAGDWCYTTKASICRDVTANSYAGIALGEAMTSSPTTSDFWILAQDYGGSGSEISVSRWSSYTTFSSNDAQTGNGSIPFSALYLRISRISSTYRFLYSFDGVGWVLAYSTSSAPFTPAEIALVTITDHGGTIPLLGRFRFIRKTAGADYFEPVLGVGV